MLQVELKVVGGKQHGSLIPLQTKKFLVGREQDCQLRPSSESVSRHHCVFTIDDYSIRLRDLGSTNGTFVNGQRVQGQVILQPNDRVLIGKLEFEVVIHGVIPVAQPARATVSVSDSNSGFSLSELAETPENADAEISPADLNSDSTPVPSGMETTLLNAENTAVISPPIPTAPTTPTAVEPAPAAVAQAGGAMPGMPGAPAAMMPPYGMQPPMPGYPPSPYGQVPYAGYPPQYMPNPYGMQPGFMPPGYVDPYQMAYQQQMAQLAMSQAAAIAEPTEAESAQAAAQNAPPVKLPPPEETGVKAPAPPPPPPAPTAEGGAAPAAAPLAKPNQLAADILKKIKGGGR